jgi:hypothetical protein
VKPTHLILLVVAILLVVGYIYFYKESLEQDFLAFFSTKNESKSAVLPVPIANSVQISWQTVDRTADGFKTEMPAEPEVLQVPAYNENGDAEAVNMIQASPSRQITFAITWEDNPPVARLNGHVPDRTLNMARDGMLTRTQTVLVSEDRVTPNGEPGREIVARNAGGGILNARLIFTGQRLYTLMAMFPSSSARREGDVTRFYNSFTPTTPPVTPLSAPGPGRE